jgi:hypothetical protein
MSQAKEVAQWLTGLGYEAQAVKVTIGDQTWEGAVYMNPKLGDGPRYYLVGDMPKWYGKSPGSCYRLEGDDADWYVICYMQQADKLSDFHKPFHPFGNSWSIGRWEADGKIDDYERSPYKRRPMTVEVVE